jgi:hypothetical protein
VDMLRNDCYHPPHLAVDGLATSCESLVSMHPHTA